MSIIPGPEYNPKKNPCTAKVCGWDGKSIGCTTPGCFGPAIFRFREKRHLYKEKKE